MNLNVFSNIVRLESLVSNLDKKNLPAFEDLAAAIPFNSYEEDCYLFKCLLSYFDIVSEKGPKECAQSIFLRTNFSKFAVKSSFASLLCSSLEEIFNSETALKSLPGSLQQLLKILHLTKLEEVIFCLAILESTVLESAGEQLLQIRLPDFIRSYIDTEFSSQAQETSFAETSVDTLCALLRFLDSPDSRVPSDLRQSFLESLTNDFPKNCVPVILAPLLYTADPPESDQIAQETLSLQMENLSIFIKNLGFFSCSTIEECSRVLREYGSSSITPSQVASVIVMMTNTSTSSLSSDAPLQSLTSSWNSNAASESGGSPNMPTSWNVEIFIQAVKDVCPNVNAKEVIYGLDCPNFNVPHPTALKVLNAAVAALGLSKEKFPIEFLLGKWSNIKGQLSWIDELLRNQEVFSFSDFPNRLVNTAETKLFDEDQISKKHIATWKNLDLVKCLLHIAGSNYPEVTDQVKSVFSLPLKTCPDVLLFTLLHIDPNVKSPMKDLLITSIVNMFIDNPNAVSILTYAYNSHSTMQPLVIQSLGMYYMMNDLEGNRIQRVLEVINSLGHKAVQAASTARLERASSMYAFGLEVAMYGANRDFLNLDKYLSDHLKSEGEQFAIELIQFIQRRLPLFMSGKEQHKAHAHKLKHILGAIELLKDIGGTFSPDTTERILTISKSAQPLIQRFQIARNTAAAAAVQQRSGESGASPVLGASGGGGGGIAAGLQSHAGGLAGLQSPQKLPPFMVDSGNGGGGASIGGISSQMQNMSLAMGYGSYSKPGGVTSLQSADGPSLDSGAATSSQTTARPRPTSPVQYRIVAPTLQRRFTNEVEDEANDYFIKIYNHPTMEVMSIESALSLLKQFKDSASKHERDVFLCMIRNLLEEYQFFPQYPEKELQITAQMFGGIIAEELIEMENLGIALKNVLEALRKEVKSKMFAFGITALDRFKHRLHVYPQYCIHLANTPNFAEFPPQLREFVNNGREEQLPPPAASCDPPQKLDHLGRPVEGREVLFTTGSSSAGGPDKQPSIAVNTNIDILVANAPERHEEPDQHTQDKVAFIFNNLSQSNNGQKAEELKEIITETTYPWLARYLVLKRVTIENNFHALYATFLQNMTLPVFDFAVLNETIRNIKVLFTSDKPAAQSNFSDRSLLKNLGHWLGMITLARNRPILHKHVDLKSLLLEAYSLGPHMMLYVIPFVTKVLESAAKSKVFQPPNPWTMAILSILAEMHAEPGLKLNLKFEVEVLCRSMDLEIPDLQSKVRYSLKAPETFSRIVHQLTPVLPKAAAGKMTHDHGGMAGGHDQDMHMRSQPPVPAASAVQMSAGSAAAAVVQQQPHNKPIFAYHDINVYSISSGLSPHIRDTYMHQLFQSQTHLRALIRPTIERTVSELLVPVVERCVKIAVTTCEQMIKKDFALDPEEVRMRGAAHNITRYLTATMTMITCKEPLLVSCTNNLKNQFLQQVRGNEMPNQKEMIEQLANQIALDNYELCVAFIQKSAIEKAIPEIDKKLATDFELRKHARIEGRRYCDPKILTYQAERMPEQLRLKVGTVLPHQLVVYEEFGREIPGFSSRAPATATADPNTLSRVGGGHMGSSGVAAAAGGGANDDINMVYTKMCTELEQHLKAVGPVFPGSPLVNAMKNLLENVMRARSSREIMAALSLLSKTVESLLINLNSPSEPGEVLLRFRDSHLLVLKGLQDPRAYGAMWTNKNVTKVVTESRDTVKYSVDAIDCLIKNRLVNMHHYDMYLTSAMENGFNYHVVSFAIKLVQKYLFDENSTNALLEAKYADLFNTVEMLVRIGSQSRSPPEELSRLTEMIRTCVDNTILDRSTPGAPINMMHSGISQAREFDDPPGLKEKTDILLREWVTMYHSQGGGKDSTKAFSTFVTQMHTQGILKTDDLITRFFRICTEVCVDVCYRALTDVNVTNNPSLTRARCYHTLDAFVRLIALLVRHSGDAANTLTKINLLNKVLGLLTGVMLQDHELRNTDFQQLPYHRIFIMLLLELCAPDDVLDGINFQVLTAFSYTLHVLRPSKAPGFAYAWLELISHRIFIARMLHITPQQKAWAMYAQLLIDQFRFLAPFLRNAELSRPVQLLYKGTLRVLLVLLHDFPEFLCEHHYVFADVIPPNCIQMRNLILSAFPRHMRLPDPFTPDLKVDMLREIVSSPRILTNFAANIPSSLKKDLDLYLKSRSPVTFLSELRSHLQISNEPGMRYNVPLMNALVLYVGVSAIQVIQSVGKAPSMSTIPHSPHMDVYQNLAVDLDTEGRYLFLNAIANHLRFPNNHTHYFSCTLLYLFAEANSEHIQEQITRVLLERVIVNRPHPWGLLITFIELINNPNFKFWTHEFVRCAPEIEKLFDSVAKSCMQRKEPSVGPPAPIGQSSGGSGGVRGDPISPVTEL